MQRKEVKLCCKGTAEGILGVNIARDGSCMTLTQTGLITWIIEASGLYSLYFYSVITPAETSLLPCDANSPPVSGTINYISTVEVLFTNASQEDVIKYIGRYLKGTADKGLALDPNDNFRLDYYPDANYTGLWGRKNPQDPHWVWSCKDYVITLAGYPIL